MKLISTRAFSFAETGPDGLFTGRHFTMYANVPTETPDWVFQTKTFQIESASGAIQACATIEPSIEALEPLSLSEVETESEES